MIEIYKIERTNRKSLSISVTQEGIIVKAPLSLPELEIHRFLNEKKSWIEAKVKKINNIQNQFRDVMDYKKLLLYGKEYYGYSSTSVSKITVTDDKILIPSNITPDKLHKKIIGWYKKLAESYLVLRTKEIAKLINLNPSLIKCTGSRGRWGACNSSRQIFLNWRCIMLPSNLIDYIIVHELSHILELNHSSKFWTIVQQILPDYKLRKQNLKAFGFLLKLY